MISEGQAPNLQAHMAVCRERFWNPFLEQTHHPQSVQSSVLRRILLSQADTVFGKEHHFQNMQAYRDFLSEVPIQTYEELRPYIQGQEDSKEMRINNEFPQTYALTSGTTGKPKFLPILSRTREALQHYQLLSTYAQYQSVPSIFQGSMLVIAGPEQEGFFASGTPYGSMSGILTAALPPILQQKLLPMPQLQSIKDYQQKYLYLAACALAEPNLSVAATANPSTFLKLFDMGRQHFSQILSLLSENHKRGNQEGMNVPCLTAERLSYLQSFLGQEECLTVEDLWPNLVAIVTWMGGSCGVLIPKLQSVLSSKTTIVEMGYLSSEFLGSINVDPQTNRCVPTFHETFFEFIEREDWETDQHRILTLDQLEQGKMYYVIVTTSNGLYRYFINDLVEVTGYFHQTPTIRFVQKGKGVTNLTGEKLYEYHVINAMEVLQQAYHCIVDFYVMLADPTTLQYTLYIEPPESHFFEAPELEGLLAQANIEFQAKRESGRLHPLRLVFLKPGTGEAYKVHCIQQGQREAQFKVVKLQYVKDCSFDFQKYRKET